jgi:hypothetical protein
MLSPSNASHSCPGRISGIHLWRPRRYSSSQIVLIGAEFTRAYAATSTVATFAADFYRDKGARGEKLEGKISLAPIADQLKASPGTGREKKDEAAN